MTYKIGDKVQITWTSMEGTTYVAPAKITNIRDEFIYVVLLDDVPSAGGVFKKGHWMIIVSANIIPLPPPQ